MFVGMSLGDVMVYALGASIGLAILAFLIDHYFF
jgi:hypothetical protein